MPWYPDADGDDYGDADGEAMDSCAPLAGHALRATDCDDTRASLHPAAREICDGVDNDCDGAIDDGGVCLCQQAGASQSCACDAASTGTQRCEDGLWSACDCTECVEGVRDCLGDLIPRHCVGGRWQTMAACSGLRPICQAGQCLCSDGTSDCQEIIDFAPPRVVLTDPMPEEEYVWIGNSFGVQFSEDMRVSSINATTLTLTDAYGDPVPATVAAGGNQATLTPIAPLRLGTPYRLRVGPGVADLHGAIMGQAHEVDFVTTHGRDHVLVVNDPNAVHTGAAVAMNDAGLVLLAANRTNTGSDGVVGTARSAAGVWEAPTSLMASVPAQLAVAVDGAGTGFAAIRQGGDMYRAVRSGGTWGGLALVDSGDVVTLPPVALLNEAGDGFSVSTNNLSVHIQPRTPGGVFTSANAATAGGSPGAWRGALGAGGHGVLGYGVGSRIDVVRWNPGLAGLSAATAQMDPLGNPAELDLAMNGTGQALMVWQQWMTVVGVGPVPVLVWARLLANNSWEATPAALEPVFDGQSQELPRLGFDGAGDALVVYSVGGSELRGARYTVASGWGASVVLTPPQPTVSISNLQFEVAQSGTAVAVWNQSAWFGKSGAEVWTVRYTPGSGWSRAQRLSDAMVDAGEPALAIGATGKAVVVFEHAGLRALDL